MFKIDGKKIDILPHRERTAMLTSDANVNETGGCEPLIESEK